MRSWRTWLALAAALAPAPAWGWGANGHRVVGEIAEHHLSSQARRQIAVLLDGESLAEASTWADEIRADPAWARATPWHYMSIDDSETLATTARAPEGDVLEALRRFEEVMRDPAASKQEKADALRFYVHFTGDVHQPLHVGRRADRGGNEIRVKWFGKETNLHSVWDVGLIESEQLSFTELTRFIDDPTPAQVAAWQAAPYETWVKESFCLRSRVYDFGSEAAPDPADPPNLGYAYAFHNLPLVKERLLAAGVRLAGRLDSIFSDAPPPLPAEPVPTDPAAWCAQ